MKFNKARKLWYSDKEQIIESITRKVCKRIDVESWDVKSDINEIVDTELSTCQIYQEYATEGESKFAWRLAFVLWIPLQFLLLPFLAVKWLFGYGWYLKSDSKLCTLIRRIEDNS